MPKESLKLQAYNIIKGKIVRCEYEPGMLLSEDRLQEDVPVSRTPIRDALSRLEQEGLVQILPKKGVMVSILSLREITSIFEVRMLLEPYALRHYGPSLSTERLTDFYDQFRMMQAGGGSDRYYEVDDAFHQMLIEALPNTYLLETYDHIHNQNLRFRMLTGMDSEDRLRSTHAEHLEIVQACLKKQWEAAAQAMEEHLQQSKKATFELLMRTEGRIE
jgi:DNA-binding GntR family transcriptional regulator